MSRPVTALVQSKSIRGLRKSQVLGELRNGPSRASMLAPLGAQSEPAPWSAAREPWNLRSNLRWPARRGSAHEFAQVLAPLRLLGRRDLVDYLSVQPLRSAERRVGKEG